MFSKIPSGVKMFALIWLVVLLTPPLRELFVAQQQIATIRGGSSWAVMAALEESQPASPDDLPTQSEALFAQFSSAERDADVLRRWDKLAAKHPRAVWLRADRLRATTSGGVSLLPQPKGTTGPSQRWLTPRVLEETIACARAARQAEPDNGFWSWMEAVFALKAGREPEAQAALERAGRAPRFNDYLADFTRRRFALLERVHPIIYEEKLPVYSGQLLPHLGPMRVVCLEFTQRGLKLRAQNNQKDAFKLFGIVLRAGAALRKNSDLQIGALVGFGIEKTLWRAIAKPQGVSVPENSGDDAHWQRAVAAFDRVSTRAGHADLANLSQAELSAGQQDGRVLQLQARTENDIARSIFGVSSNEARVATQGAFLLVYAAVLAFASALLWIFGRLWTHPNSPAPTRGEIARSANFSFWSILGALALLWVWNVGGDFLWFSNEMMGSEDTVKPRDIASAAFPVAGLLIWLLPIAWTTKKRRFKRSSTQLKAAQGFRVSFVLRALLWVLAVAFGLISFASGAQVWQNTILAFPIPLNIMSLCLLALLVLEVRLWKTSETPTPLRRFVAVGFALFVLAVHAPWVLNPWFRLSWWFLPALVVCGFALTFLPSRPNENSNRPLDFFITSASRSAGVLAVALSAFFLLGALSVWPIRAKMNRQLERRLAIGERVWMAEQLK